MALNATIQAYKPKRCKYCGAKLTEKYDLMWCSKPCKLGALDLDIYERENHLGPYAPDPEPEIPDPNESE